MIKYLLHQHPINRYSHKTRGFLKERKNSVFVIIIALVLSLIYYFLNEINDNNIMKFIAENNFVQSIIIFLTISSFINIFYPFTLKKQIDKKDIETITRETIKEDIENKEIKKRATF